MQTFLQPLSRQEEQECLTELGSPDVRKARHAKEKLIMHNLRLVAHIARKYQSSAEDAEDLISVGVIGLMKAIDTFHAEKGRLAAYASRCIENAILSQMRICR